MKQQFKAKLHLSKQNKEKLEQINSIIQEYQRGGYVMTLRQLYYQLVSRDIIPNKDAEYKKIGNLLKEGRMSGIVDWKAIEDRVRIPSRPFFADSPEDGLDTIINQYRLDRMKEQDIYIEVWVEKDALSGVLKRVTQKYGINIMINRGYSSVSAMYDAYNRFKDAIDEGQKVVVLYLGDYDPSGIDMIRDVRDRISEFFLGCDESREQYEKETTDTASDRFNEYGRELYWKLTDEERDNPEVDTVYKEYIKDKFKITPIALNREQIDLYNPPPNPAKVKDPRSGKFIEDHGHQSWEVDALPPKVLNEILEDSIFDLIDQDLYNQILEQEKDDIIKLKKVRDNWANLSI